MGYSNNSNGLYYYSDYCSVILDFFQGVYISDQWKPAALTFTFIYIGWQLFQKKQSQAAESMFVALHHCGNVKAIKTSWPLGLDLILSAFQHASEHHLLKFFTQLIEDTGYTFEQRLLGTIGVDTVDPKNIKAVLSSQFIEFGLGDRRPTFAPLLGDGIFTQQAEPWRHSRELLRPLFSQNRAQNFTQIKEHARALLNCIPENSVTDLQPLFFRLKLDTTTVLLFGQSINSLKDPQGQESDFAKAFRVAQGYLCQRGRLGPYYWLIGGREFRKACTTVHHFIGGIVSEALKADSKVDKSRYVFLDALIQETRDPKVLRDQLLNVLLAGRDTTACCLSWAFRLLCRHPSVLKKLRKEVESIVGVGKGARNPTQNDIKKMLYLSHVLKETLRLYPSVPINSRTALKTTTLPTGGGPDGTSSLLIRKGEAVGYCVYAMHRRRDLYGENANEFEPERWEGEKLNHIGYGYLPFNGGPRLCLGQEFAILEASYTIVLILQSFTSFEVPPDDVVEEIGEEKQEVSLVVTSVDGCRVKFGARS